MANKLIEINSTIVLTEQVDQKLNQNYEKNLNCLYRLAKKVFKANFYFSTKICFFDEMQDRYSYLNAKNSSLRIILLSSCSRSSFGSIVHVICNLF